MILSEWARELGMSYKVLQGRKNAGWSDAEVLMTPKGVYVKSGFYVKS
jgi:hypothetical protein